ncbi:hypothetical protein GCM10027562_13430 [Arthrobacter pigmenti]
MAVDYGRDPGGAAQTAGSALAEFVPHFSGQFLLRHAVLLKYSWQVWNGTLHTKKVDQEAIAPAVSTVVAGGRMERIRQ